MAAAATIVFPVPAATAPADLCERLSVMLLATGAAVAVCDVAELPADAAAIDALARLALTARRIGRRVALRHPSPDLRELLAFAGLDETLRVEAGGQPEQRK